jgi:hypothetical protein
MNLWNRMKLYAGRKLNIPGFTLIPNMFYNWFINTKNQKYNQVLPKDPSYKQLRNFSRNAIVRIPIEHIEDTISRLPFQIMNIDPNDTKDYTKQKQIALKVIRNPNAVQSWIPFSKMILEDLVTIGAGVFQPRLGGNPDKPLYLYPADASTIQFVVPYDYQNPDSARYMQQQQDGMHYFSANELAYIQKNFFSDRPQGLSPVRAAYDYIQYLLNAAERADNVASNATADFLIHLKGLTDTQRQEFIKYMQEEIEGTGTIPVSAGPDDVQTAQIRAINKDSLMLDYQEFLRVIVGIAFKYPPQRMGVMKSGDRSTEADLDNYILENCIKPWANIIEDAINDYVLKPLGYSEFLRFSFIYNDTEAQKKAKSDRITKEYISGIIDRNTALDQLGYGKSNSKYADMDINEAKANINKDLNPTSGGFNGLGDTKDNYSDKTTDNKLNK